MNALREQPEAQVFILDRQRRTRLNGRNATSPSVRVLIADAHALVRAGFRALLEDTERIAVVGEAGDGVQAVALARRLRPDVVLLDADLPGLDCVEATRQLLAEPGGAVMLLTGSVSDDRLFDALRVGASGLLLKDTEPTELVRGVELLARGEALLSPGVTRRLIAELASRPEPELPDSDLIDELTAREREVMTLVALGLTNEEIGERLVVSRATAKTHVSRAMVKLHARDRAQLVVFAYESGLTRPRADATAPERRPLALV
jgi:DNA-binding NarL/FixJ family response regulator